MMHPFKYVGNGQQHKVEYRGLTVRICSCECHKEGVFVRHIVACCDICYKQYIDAHGLPNKVKLSECLEEHYQWTLENKK